MSGKCCNGYWPKTPDPHTLAMHYGCGRRLADPLDRTSMAEGGGHAPRRFLHGPGIRRRSQHYAAASPSKCDGF
jgi:hypothetical protein